MSDVAGNVSRSHNASRAASLPTPGFTYKDVTGNCPPVTSLFLRQDFGECGACFGRRISRRPNMRASSENAPGPRRDTATANPIVSIDVWSNPDKARTAAPTVTKIAISGVINPTSKQAALIKLKTTTIQPSAPTLVAAKCAAVCASNVELTSPRKRRRPTPGPPLGKAENSFCRTTLLQREIRTSVSLRMLNGA